MPVMCIAERHIGQGWPLAYMTQRSRRGVFSLVAAARIACISACAEGSCVARISLTPVANTSSSLTRTAPKGRPPRSSTFSLARRIASARCLRFMVMVCFLSSPCDEGSIACDESSRLEDMASDRTRDDRLGNVARWNDSQVRLRAHVHAVVVDAERSRGAMRGEIECDGEFLIGEETRAVCDQHRTLQHVRVAVWPPRVANVVVARDDGHPCLA